MIIPINSSQISKLIPAVGTGSQFKYALGNPRKILQRVIVSSIGGFISLIISSTGDQTNNFWLLNLGTEVNINYLLDPYGIAPYISRNYKASTFSIPYFTPNFILHLVHNFYQEPMTKEELQLQQEENPLAGDYSLEDADEGKVLRIDMFENPIFQGFSHLMDNNRYILL